MIRVVITGVLESLSRYMSVPDWRFHLKPGRTVVGSPIFTLDFVAAAISEAQYELHHR